MRLLRLVLLIDQVPPPERLLLVFLGQEPLPSWLVFASVDWDEVLHLLPEEHLGWQPACVLVSGVPVGQQGSTKLVIVESSPEPRLARMSLFMDLTPSSVRAFPWSF